MADVMRNAAQRHRELILAPYDELYAQFGYDVVCAVADLLGGNPVYVPGKRKIFLRCLEAEAKRNFKGDYNALSKLYGISPRQLRRIVLE